MAGGADQRDLLKGFQQASPGMGASNPQAMPGGLHPSVAPWMQQLGGMGNQMMQAGMQRPLGPMTHPQIGPGPGLMQMPQPLTPTHMNQMLAQHTGLMGPRGMQF